jgi:hypothetical protein
MAHAAFCDKFHQLATMIVKEKGMTPAWSLEHEPRRNVPMGGSENDIPEGAPEFDFDGYDLPDGCVTIYQEMDDHDYALWN